MKTLIMGQKAKLGDLGLGSGFKVDIQAQLPNFDVDITCFGVDEHNQLSDDRYFIFYNQLSSPDGEIVKRADKNEFTIQTDSLPQTINRLVFTAAVDGDAYISRIKEGVVSLKSANTEEVLASYTFQGAQLQREKAIILIEVYRYQGEWRIAVVGRGFNGGLRELLGHYGGQEETSTPQPNPTPALKVSLSKEEQVKKVVLEKAPHLIELTKKAIITLEKKNLTDVEARVVLVLDRTGSMNRQYKTGRVQRLLDKVLPLALLFDDDGTLESWAFADSYRELADITVDNIGNYVETADGGWKLWDVGGTNNGPAVMEALYMKYKSSDLPVYIIFISDGGVSKNRQLKQIITTAAYAPMFWQFIGISGTNYGVLEKLDTMTERYIDNANFFALDDLDDISDEELYDRLMGEFPEWLKEARQKEILN